MWVSPWHVPVHVREVPDPLVDIPELAGANTTFTIPFTCKEGPVMAAVEAPVPLAIPLWQSEQLKVPPAWAEWAFVDVFGIRWHALQARVPPEEGTFHTGTAAVWPFVKLPWQ